MTSPGVEDVVSAFESEFGGKPRVFSAPGRVNLIGEHTDYNDGFVLPMAIQYRTTVAARARPDRRVRVRSLDMGDSAEFQLDHPGPKRRGVWLDYVEGVAQALLARGFTLCGADISLSSTVPRGAGLSSSAALELSVGLALASLGSDQPLDFRQLALAGQAAEHEYVGTMCGIMDQLVAALGQRDHALFIDCRSLEAKRVQLDLGDVVVLIINSRVSHSLASSEYNKRRAECQEGLGILARDLPGIVALRDVAWADFERLEANLPEPVRSRCRHVIAENDRTARAAVALNQGELAEFGRLMDASHWSLSKDYEVSCPELDFLVKCTRAQEGVLGARMTGGGFGGCTVNMVRREHHEAVAREVTLAYEKEFGKAPEIFVSQAADGAREELFGART